jgi:hypothetical protein
MKGTIIGTDYLEKDDSLKILEINTNTTIINSGADLLDYDAFFSVLIENNINELHFIYTEGDAYLPENAPNYRFEDLLKERCVLNNIEYFKYTLPRNSVTVPYIEDTPNRFILRQSYDTTALLDESYCADKYGFLDLMRDTDLIPKTYFSNDEISLDTLNALVFNNSVHPNVTIKKRFPKYDLKVYPKIYGLDDIEQLDVLKNELEANSIIQEFVYDVANVVDGKWSVIRGIDIVYGSNLDVVSLGGYKQSTVVGLDFCENEYEGDTKYYNQKTRFKWITKANGDNFKVLYHLDAESSIVMSDDTLKNISEIEIGDSLKSFDFEDLNGLSTSGDGNTLPMWDGTFEKTTETFNLIDTNVVDKKSSDVKALFVRITLENGVSWIDSPASTFYIEEKNSLETRWEIANALYVGDKIILFNHQTNEVQKLEIESLSVEYFEQTIYEIDVEGPDVFLTNIDNQYPYYVLMHNNCNCCSGVWNCGNWCCYNYCSGCNSGGFEKFN